MRKKDTARARELYKRYVACHPHTRAFLKWARWEEKQGQLALSRGAFERALSELDEDSRTEKLYISFAQRRPHCTCTAERKSYVVIAGTASAIACYVKLHYIGDGAHWSGYDAVQAIA
eukprot:9059-Heterococcus_DN1.PRE.2